MLRLGIFQLTLAVLLFSKICIASAITLNSTNYAEVRFEIPGEPMDFTVTPHLFQLELGGSSFTRTQTTELFDGTTLISTNQRSVIGGVVEFWRSLELPSLNGFSVGPLVDFAPIRNKSIDGIIRVYIEDQEHTFDPNETILRLFDCETNPGICTVSGFTPQPTITSIQVLNRPPTTEEFALNSSNFAEVRFEIPGAPYDFTVVPHLFHLQLGGSSGSRKQTIELFDGNTKISSKRRTASGGVVEFWRSLELPSINPSTVGPLIDFTPIRNKTIDGIIRIYIDDSTHTFKPTETKLNLFDCVTNPGVCTLTGFAPKPIINSVRVYPREVLEQRPVQIPIPLYISLILFALISGIGVKMLIRNKFVG